MADAAGAAATAAGSQQKSVRVVVRVRPLLHADGDSDQSLLKVEAEKNEVVVYNAAAAAPSTGPGGATTLSSQQGAGKRYGFDSVFGSSTKQVIMNFFFYSVQIRFPQHPFARWVFGCQGFLNLCAIIPTPLEQGPIGAQERPIKATPPLHAYVKARSLCSVCIHESGPVLAINLPLVAGRPIHTCRGE